MRDCLKPPRGGRRTGRLGTGRHDFVDVTRQGMMRCPLSSCSYRPLNMRSLRRSLKVHCGAYHKTVYRYIYRFPNQQGWGEFTYPTDPIAEEGLGATQETVSRDSHTEHPPQPQIGGGRSPRRPSQEASPVNPTVPRRMNEGASSSTGMECTTGGKTLVDKGTRLRRGRRTEGQPKLLPWIQAREIEKIIEQRTAGGLVPKNPEWNERKEPHKHTEWSQRYDKNANTPLHTQPVIRMLEDQYNTSSPQETQEDWWNDLVRDEEDDQ